MITPAIQYTALIESLFIQALEAPEGEAPAKWKELRDSISYALEEDELTKTYRQGLSQLLHAVDFCQRKYHTSDDPAEFIAWHARFLSDQDLMSLQEHYALAARFNKLSKLSTYLGVGSLTLLVSALVLNLPILNFVGVATLTTSIALRYLTAQRLKTQAEHIRKIGRKSWQHLRELVGSLCADPQ
jgi:hypothetical protein